MRQDMRFVGQYVFDLLFFGSIVPTIIFEVKGRSSMPHVAELARFPLHGSFYNALPRFRAVQHCSPQQSVVT
jgi:hypothetical protein